MKDEDLELLSELIDDRVVDPRALAAVLERPEGRAALVEMAGLRAELRNDAERPGDGFYEGMRGRLRVRAWRRVAAAAAALLLALLAGWTLRGPVESVIAAHGERKPPEAAAVVRFERGVDWSGSLGGES